ncbi:MAG: hypothetical protein R3Y23_01450 [Bacillota bacterium]
MHKTVKRILLILLILVLSFSVISCGSSTDTDSNSGSGSGSSGAVTDTTVDKAALNAQITDSFTNTSGVVQSQDIKHVSIEHTFIANTINVTITYEADYNFTRTEDSEIMLKVFDNQFAYNTFFLYYYEGTLYYEYDYEKVAIEGFGATSTFDTFFDIMLMFDIEDYIFGADFIDLLSMMLVAADSTNMSSFDIDGTSTNITIKDINLDTTKSMVNDFLEAVFGEQTFGTKLDALTSAFLGFELSDLGNMEIGLFNVSEMEVILKDIAENGETVSAISSFNVVFSGTQADNINTYYYEFKYTTSSESSKIDLSAGDDITTNDYNSAKEGVSHYIGTVYINSLATEFDTEIKSNISLDSNDNNQISITVGDIITSYLNGTDLYLNIEGLTSLYLGNGIDLESLGFPQVVFNDVDLAGTLSDMLSYITTLTSLGVNFEDYIDEDFWDSLGELTSSNEAPNFLVEGSLPDIILDRISSNGTEFTVNIDSTLFGILIGDYETTIMDYITTALGIPEETVYTLLGADELAELVISFTYDTATAAIGIVLYSGTETIMEIELYSQFISEDADFVIEEPTNRYDRDVITSDEGETSYSDPYFNYDEYETLGTIECTTLYLEGTLRIQGTNTVDMSAFFGAFIGDSTGVNTPFSFALNDMIYLEAYLWIVDGQTYVWAELKYQASGSSTAIDLVSIYTSSDAEDYYVSCIWVDADFIISADGLYQAFEDLLGVDNIFADTDMLSMLRTLTSDTIVDLEDDCITFTLAPYTAYGVTTDPIYDLIGIENMIADLSAVVTFSVPDIVTEMEEAIASGNYYQPIVSSIDECIYDSVYNAEWVETVTVSFGNTITQTFYLSFIGESAEIVSGQYYYEPTAQLFGQGVSYILVLTDQENGTKNIIALYFENNEGSIQIDPTEADAIPVKIGVVYDDGTIGEQYFTIVGFPYVNDTSATNCISTAMAGVDATNYTIIIGENSIKETIFENVSVEILNRNISPVDNEYRVVGKENIPVVMTVTIDPYEYSIQKEADSSYSPIPSDLTLWFNNVSGDSVVDSLTIYDFEWDFDESLIDYVGGWFYTIAYYNTVQVCLKVTVVAKTIDYVSIQSVYDSSVYENGYYTLDSMDASSYYMPTTSTEGQEIRIYFITGNYRIIGEEPEDYVQTDAKCDGYFDIDLTWLYEYADNVSLDTIINPLNGGKTNVNVATFGDSISGLQTVNVVVLAPSRRVSTMTDLVSAITTLAVDADTGKIDEANTVWTSSRISAVGLGEVDGIYDEDGIYFEIDPYGSADSKQLPSTVILTITYGANNTTIRWEYDITWVASTIIDENGNILMPLAEENYSIAIGYIGTGSLKQQITVCIHNLSGEFDELYMIDANTGDEIVTDSTGNYTITINPYDAYILPTEFTLVFNGEYTTTRTYTTEWYLYNSVTGEDEELTKFSYLGGTYILHSYVAEDRENSILQQQITLVVNVLPQTVESNVIYDLSDQLKYGSSATSIVLDPYSDESGEVLAKIMSDDSLYGLLFTNGDTAYGLPIEWTNLDEVVDLLQNDIGTIVLYGLVYSEYESLVQEVSVTITVLENSAAAISLDNLDSSLVSKKVLSYLITESEGTIELNINMPYLLEIPGESGVINVTDYLFYLLEVVTVYTADGQTYTIDLSEFLGDYDTLNTALFSYNYGDYSEVERTIVSLTNGSRQDNFTIIITTVYDAMSISSLPIYVETFSEDGTPKYLANDYELPDYVDVTYGISGTVTYENVSWVVYADIMLDGSIKYSSGDSIEVIDSELIDSINGMSIYLATTLPNGTTIIREFHFYAKNIDLTRYDATAESDSNYTISSGLITINNIYDIYPFDFDAIPTTIVPQAYSNTSGKYEVGDTITFTVTWDFYYDADSIAEYIVATGQSVLQIGEAVIEMYNGVNQTIELYLVVQSLTTTQAEGEILDFDIDCDSVLFDDDNDIYVDPYVTNYGGNLVLPTELSIYFGANGTTHYFSSADKYSLTYEICNIYDEWATISEIAYTHLGHSLGDDYGATTDTLDMRIILPDGSYIAFTLEFYSREYVSIAMQNFSDKDVDDDTLINGTDYIDGTYYIDKTYYIDPYNSATFTLPTEALFTFKEGDSIYIDGITWSVYDSTGNSLISDYELFTNNRFNLTDSSYEGGTYILKSSLSGYGVEAQEFEITVYVIDRSLSTELEISIYSDIDKIEISSSSGDYSFNLLWTIGNPFATVVSDMEDTLSLSMFAVNGNTVTEDSDYYAYLQIANLVIPTIDWDMTNDDIDYDGMYDEVYDGTLTADGVTLGESASVTINANKYVFAQIAGCSDNVIDFNPYTLESELKSYDIEFNEYVYVESSNSYIYSGIEKFTFTPSEFADFDDSYAIIDFGEHSITSDTTYSTFTLGNTQKTDDWQISVDGKYIYSYTQVYIEELDFGYGYGSTGIVEFVIDPLNPVIPEEALAQGSTAGSDSEASTEHGSVTIVWDDELYEYIQNYNATEDYALISLTVKAQIGTKTYDIPFEVRVYLLNRTPTSITTTDVGYTTTLAVNGEYTLMYYNSSNTQVWNFVINPTDETIYVEETNTYIMPTNITYYFKSTYSNTALQTAAKLLGSSMVFVDIDWELSEAITLDGTPDNYYISLDVLYSGMFYYTSDYNEETGTNEASPCFYYDYENGMYCYVREFDSDENEYVGDYLRYLYNSDETGIDSSFQLQLTVTSSSVEMIYMVTDDGYIEMTQVINATDGTTYLKAIGDFAIDPYELNYSSSFPTTIAIKYYNDTTLVYVDEVEWIFDTDYLERSDVIDGSIADNSNPDVDVMTTMVEFPIYGTTIAIQFPIKARDIEATSTDPIDGGTIYVLMGEDLESQLPNYLYYSFIYEGQTDITAVPLSFSSGTNGLYGLNTNEVRTYTGVYATLGAVDSYNILFTIQVIDPQVTSIITIGDSDAQGALIYDTLVVARNNNNIYTSGLETSLLPDIVIVDDYGSYLTVEDIEYVISFDSDGTETSYAKFTCSYTFISSSSTKISGDAEGNTILPIYFSVPITSYDYTKLDSDLTLDSSASIEVELDTHITTDALPTLTSASGAVYEIFWNLSEVDIALAGTYTATGTYMTSGGNTRYVSVPVVVTKAQVTTGDIALSDDWFTTYYSGTANNIADYLTIEQFMRENGEYGNVEGYSVTYSSNGGATWVNLAPTNVGSYMVRIEIMDYNVEGYLEFSYNIYQYVINPTDVVFYTEESAVGKEQSTAVGGTIDYTYNSQMQEPFINNVPTSDSTFVYTITYYAVDELTYETLGVTTPINAGTYLMVFTIDSNQQNYTISLISGETSARTTYSIYVVISKIDVTYQLVNSLTYDGSSARQAEVVGLPDDYASYGIAVTYKYTSSEGYALNSMSNVGSYEVEVIIDGGTNYPDGEVSGTVTINQLKVYVSANTVTSTYLSDLKDFDSEVTILMQDENGEYTVNGLQGSDTINVFGTIAISCVDSEGNTITDLSFIGDYDLVITSIVSTNSKFSNYDIVAMVNGTYTIAKPTDGYVIEDSEELQSVYLNALEDNTVVKWYLKPGVYDAITISKNVALTIVGAYDPVTGEIGVFIDSITVEKGGLSLDVIAFTASANSTSLKIGSGASDVTLNRVTFTRETELYLSECVAIVTNANYTGTVTLTNTTFYGYATGIYIIGGSLLVNNCVFDSNISSIVVANTAQDITILNSDISYSKSVGVRFYCDSTNIIISGCVFTANMSAIMSINEVDGSISVQNEFALNANDIVIN